MSDCRFGVSPVNFPDPDPDQARVSVLLKSPYHCLNHCSNCVCFTITEIKETNTKDSQDLDESTFVRLTGLTASPSLNSTKMLAEIT